MRSMVEGARGAHRRALVKTTAQYAPSTALRAVPLPRSAALRG